MVPGCMYKDAVPKSITRAFDHVRYSTYMQWVCMHTSGLSEVERALAPSAPRPTHVHVCMCGSGMYLQQLLQRKLALEKKVSTMSISLSLGYRGVGKKSTHLLLCMHNAHYESVGPLSAVKGCAMHECCELDPRLHACIVSAHVQHESSHFPCVVAHGDNVKTIQHVQTAVELLACAVLHDGAAQQKLQRKAGVWGPAFRRTFHCAAPC